MGAHRASPAGLEEGDGQVLLGGRAQRRVELLLGQELGGLPRGRRVGDGKNVVEHSGAHQRLLCVSGLGRVDACAASMGFGLRRGRRARHPHHTPSNLWRPAPRTRGLQGPKPSPWIRRDSRWAAPHGRRMCSQRNSRLQARRRQAACESAVAGFQAQQAHAARYEALLCLRPR